MNTEGGTEIGRRQPHRTQRIRHQCTASRTGLDQQHRIGTTEQLPRDRGPQTEDFAENLADLGRGGEVGERILGRVVDRVGPRHERVQPFRLCLGRVLDRSSIPMTEHHFPSSRTCRSGRSDAAPPSGRAAHQHCCCVQETVRVGGTMHPIDLIEHACLQNAPPCAPGKHRRRDHPGLPGSALPPARTNNEPQSHQQHRDRQDLPHRRTERKEAEESVRLPEAFADDPGDGIASRGTRPSAGRIVRASPPAGTARTSRTNRTSAFQQRLDTTRWGSAARTAREPTPRRPSAQGFIARVRWLRGGMALGNTIAPGHQSGAGRPHSSPLMKFAIRPSPSPIGATMAMRSANPSSGMPLRRQNTMIAIATPSMPPWKLMPPSQTARISAG